MARSSFSGPVHSDGGFRGSDLESDSVGGQIVAIPFTIADASAQGQAVTELGVDADVGAAQVVVPGPGSIIGLSIRSQNGRTAGTLTCKPRKNGASVAATTLNTILNATNTQKTSARANKDSAASLIFAINDTVGVSWETDAAWAAGVTPSLIATLWIELKV